MTKHASQVHGLKNSKEQEYLAGWQRAQADLANFRKRMLAEQGEMSQRAKQMVLEPLLAVVDNFRAITMHLPDDLKDNAWAAGVLHVARQMDQLLADFGVTVIDQTGIPFDPRFHEAVAGEGEHVQEVVQVGYQLGEKVLKAAKVKVS